jgi:hypothetical protein
MFVPLAIVQSMCRRIAARRMGTWQKKVRFHYFFAIQGKYGYRGGAVSSESGVKSGLDYKMLFLG